MATVAVNHPTFYTNASAGQAGPLDLKSTGATKIRSDGDGGSEIVVVSGIGIDVIEVDSVTSTAVVSVGTNNPNYDNILREHAIIPEEGYSELLDVPAKRIAGSDEVYANVKIAGSGTTFTAVISVGFRPYQIA